ncbi:MAG: hypothetical protein U0232_05315 [Thermomicrobiales bacterium]
MIPLPQIALPAEANAKLQEYQQAVDALQTYAEQVAAAKSRFSQYNKIGNTTFDAVKEALIRICAGVGRCHYCEDSKADEVEHFRPKDLYPDVVFVWENYLYACGPCNGRKSNHFAILVLDQQGEPVALEVMRKSTDPVVAPRAGQPALIDPRTEDPTALIALDLRDTFYFAARPDPDTISYAAIYANEPYANTLVAALKVRAEYTIATMTMNRDLLPETRRNAYESYFQYLSRYVERRSAGAPQDALDRVIRAIQRMTHPTVWFEMKRQYRVIPELETLFTQAPEALDF